MEDEDTPKKISRSEFTSAVKVEEEKVTKEMGKLRKLLDKKKITRKEYADKRMNTVREFVELRRELQQMISDDVNSQQDSIDNDDETILQAHKLLTKDEEENTIKDEV